MRLNDRASFCRSHPLEVVFLVGEQSLQFRLRPCGQWRILNSFAVTVVSNCQIVCAKSFLIQETTASNLKRSEQVLMLKIIVSIDIYAEFPNDFFCDFRESVRCLQHHRATVAEQSPAIDGELIPFCMPTKVVMVIEDQYSGIRVHVTAIDIGGRQPTNTCTDHDKIIVFIRLFGVPSLSLNHAMSSFKGSCVRTAHTCHTRRIVRGLRVYDRIAAHTAHR